MVEERMPIKITGYDPYEEVAKIVERWCEKHYYNSALVTLSIDGVETTEYLEFDGSEMTFIWENDWWEGEKEVQLLGFRMLQDLKLYGFPNDADCEYCKHCARNIVGEWITRGGYYHCSQCGERQIQGSNFCPSCGARMHHKGRLI